MAKKAAKGAKKKGREEAVVSPQGFKGCSMEHPIFFIYWNHSPGHGD